MLRLMKLNINLKNFLTASLTKCYDLRDQNNITQNKCYDLHDQNNTTQNISSHIQNHSLFVQLISMINMIRKLSSTEQY